MMHYISSLADSKNSDAEYQYSIELVLIKFCEDYVLDFYV